MLEPPHSAVQERSAIIESLAVYRSNEYRIEEKSSRAVCFGKSFPALALFLSLSLSLSFSVSCFLSYTSSAAKAKAEPIKSNRALDYPCFSRSVTRGRAARP